MAKNLEKAKKTKNDEFYTQLSDIEQELKHYKKHFKNKIVYCNCDDPQVSNFFHYFSYNFEKLGLKKLITTCYKNQSGSEFSRSESKQAVYLEYNGDKKGNNIPDPKEIGIKQLKGDGDFRSKESIELLKEADIVVTNPPFSLFREYMAQLIEFEKEFLIIGNKNCLTYKEVFRLIKENKLWLGNRNINSDMWFVLPDNANKWEKIIDGKKLQHIMGCWFTNLENQKRHEDMILYEKYNKNKYQKYDNYDAINVNKVKEIPMDFEGVMGVPITFLDKYNPEQFELVGAMTTTKICEYNFGYPYINGKKLYARILIKNKKVVK